MIDSVTNNNRVNDLIRLNQEAAKRKIRVKLAEGLKKIRPSVGVAKKKALKIA